MPPPNTPEGQSEPQTRSQSVSSNDSAYPQGASILVHVEHPSMISSDMGQQNHGTFEAGNTRSVGAGAENDTNNSLTWGDGTLEQDLLLPPRGEIVQRPSGHLAPVSTHPRDDLLAADPPDVLEYSFDTHLFTPFGGDRRDQQRLSSGDGESSRSSPVIIPAPDPPNATALGSMTANSQACSLAGASSPSSISSERSPSDRKQRPAQKMDWHNLQYVGSYDDMLDCPICRSPLVEPRITVCFHVFCRKCLLQTLAAEERCPIDRQPLRKFKTERGFVRFRRAPPVISSQLDRLQVHCPNERCSHECIRSVVEYHYNNECPYTLVPCPDYDCDKLVTRRDSEEGGCLHKPVRCVHCHFLVELASLDQHYDIDCVQKEIPCEHCGEKVPRHRHDEHVEDCAERVIECKHKHAGCSISAKQKDFGNHEDTCLYGMVSRLTETHRADVDRLESLLLSSRDRVRKLERDLSHSRQAKHAAHPVPHFAEIPSPPVGMSGNGGVSIAQPPGPFQPSPADSQYDAGPAHGWEEYEFGMSPSGQSAPSIPVAFASESDERLQHIMGYINTFDAKVENLERHLGEVSTRREQLLVNEIGSLKDQVIDIRNNIGHVNMHVRWLVDMVRLTTKRDVGPGSVTGGVRNTNEAASGPSRATASPPPAALRSGSGSASSANSAPGSGSGSGYLTGNAFLPMPFRRLSDRENPPRL